jgi:hypothetical protein
MADKGADAAPAADAAPGVVGGVDQTAPRTIYRISNYCDITLNNLI